MIKGEDGTWTAGTYPPEPAAVETELVDFSMDAVDQDQIWQMLLSADQDGELMCCGTAEDLSGTLKAAGVCGGHAYSIIKVIPNIYYAVQNLPCYLDATL